MNKIKEQKEIRNVLDKIKHTCLSGNKINHFFSYESETESHIRKKFEVFLKLRKAGYNVLCEPIFKNSLSRMDILAWKEGIFSCYEIMESETMEKLLEKCKKYPEEINMVPIKTEQDIKDLELL